MMEGRSLLVVGDSNQIFVNEDVLVKELQLDKIVTGSLEPKKRGYCSERSWINARFPDKSLEDQVPRLLDQEKFDVLVIQAPTNDITNLDRARNSEELAKMSSMNTLRIAKNALETFKSLERVIVMPRPPRNDRVL